MTAPSGVAGRAGSRYTPLPTPDHAGDAATRVRSIDVLRGVIMILMAIDHVRVYSGLPANATTLDLFFTRWITHFCAPGFALLAGTAAFFHGRKLGSLGALSRFLLTRGALLVVLELTLVRVSWTFTPVLTPLFAGVIWMLGWSMIVLAALVHLGPKRAGLLGCGIMLLQQLFGAVPSLLPASAAAAIAPLWALVYPTGRGGGGDDVIVLYVLVPWVGVMAAGYGLGALLTKERAHRDRLCLRIGLAATAVFLLVAGALAFMPPAGSDGGAASSAPWIVRLLNQQKYPASQLFLLMTLGPLVAALPAAGRLGGRFGTALETVGRVPLFYYLLHIPLIHASALLVNALRTGSTQGEWYARAPFSSVPEEHQWPLWLLYAVFALDVAILYAACRWYAGVKRKHPRSWLRYL